MGNLRASMYAAAALVAFAACGGSSDKPDAAPVKIIDAAIDARPLDAPPDASPYDFSCYGMPFPTTADASITIAGTAQELAGTALNPAEGLTIDTYKTGNTAVDSVMTAADGTFTTGSITTGGTPLTLHDVATKDLYRDTYIFPGSPVTKSLSGVPVIVLKATDFTALVSQLSAFGITQSDANGTMILRIVDCAGNAVSGTTISAKQGTTDVSGMQLDASVAGFPGVFFVFDVPPGATDVGATLGNIVFPPHQVGVHAMSNTLTEIIPGPQS